MVQTCLDPADPNNKPPAPDGEAPKKKRGRPKAEVQKAKQTWKTHKCRPLQADEDYCECVQDFGPDRICKICKGTGIVKKTVEVHGTSIEKLPAQPPAPAAAPPAAAGPAAPSPAPAPSNAESAAKSAPISPAPAPAAAAPAAGHATDEKEPCRWGYKTAKDGFTILFNGEPKGSSTIIGYKPRSEDECKFRADQVLEKILELDARVPYDPSKWCHVWSWQSQNETGRAL